MSETKVKDLIEEFRALQTQMNIDAEILKAEKSSNYLLYKGLAIAYKHCAERLEVLT